MINPTLSAASPLSFIDSGIIPTRSLDPLTKPVVRIALPKGYAYKGLSGSALVAWTPRGRNRACWDFCVPEIMTE